MEEGKRFSLVYLDKGAPIQDSERFRRRISEYVRKFLIHHYENDIISLIQFETGAYFKYKAHYGKSLCDFLMDAELRDMLDSITLIYSFLVGNRRDQAAKNWIVFIDRVFIEENIGYRLDLKCGVHYYIDEEFEKNRFSTIAMLDNQRYIATRSAYEDAYRHFDNNPIDTKAAVRSLFESIEILVKQIVETRNLNKYIVENNLKNKFLPIYNDDETAKGVVSRMFDSFALWVDGIHLYRHGQDDDQPVRPPIELAVYILSSGSSFLRWLIELNEKLIALEQ